MSAVRTVYLGGALAEKYAPSIEVAFDKYHQLLGALVSRFGARIKADIGASNWHLFDGPMEHANEVEQETVHHRSFKGDEVHLIPAVEGGGNWTRIIIGIVLIVVGYFTYGSTTQIGMAMIMGGAAMALGGVAGLLMKPPTTDVNTSGVDDNASHIYSAAVNVVGQGTAIPLKYGRRIGRSSSVVIASDFSSDQILAPAGTADAAAAAAAAASAAVYDTNENYNFNFEGGGG